VPVQKIILFIEKAVDAASNWFFRNWKLKALIVATALCGATLYVGSADAHSIYVIITGWMVFIISFVVIFGSLGHLFRKYFY
jgi:hypothetical protein